MKNLNYYTEQAVAKCYDDNGAFWAFGKNQYEEKAVKDVVYVQLPIGCVCPKVNAEKFMKELNQVYIDGKKQMLAENSLTDIIKYELANHECYYTGDWYQAFEMTEEYGATEEQVRQIYIEESKRNNDY